MKAFSFDALININSVIIIIILLLLLLVIIIIHYIAFLKFCSSHMVQSPSFELSTVINLVN